jgi:putative peptidoglycan lipid II flippase
MSSISNAISEKNMRSVYIQQNSSLRRSLMLIIPCVIGLFVLAEPIIKNLFQYGAWTSESTHAVAVAIMIQCMVLPAMLTSQIYSKTLYASMDVKTPVKTSIISLGVATVLYVGLFYHLGYLAIPVGVVISGYVKNILLARACKKRGLIKLDGKTIRCGIGFTILSCLLGVGLWFAPVDGLLSMCIAIAVFGILYLPVAYIIDKKA